MEFINIWWNRKTKWAGTDRNRNKSFAVLGENYLKGEKIIKGRINENQNVKILEYLQNLELKLSSREYFASRPPFYALDYIYPV